VAAAAEEGDEGLELRPEDRAVLLEGWSDGDVDDALSLVRDSLMLAELVEAADVVTARLMTLLGAYAHEQAFETARRDGGRIPFEAIAHLARNLDRLDQILDVYRDDPGPDRRGFDALRARLADSGIEGDMAAGRGGNGEPRES